MKIINIALKSDIDSIIERRLVFEKGTVSGNSIEIFDPQTDSYLSYTYYDDVESRDNDLEILNMNIEIL